MSEPQPGSAPPSRSSGSLSRENPSGKPARGTSAPAQRYGRIELLLATALALPLAIFGLVGTYSRYTADDFCWAGVLRTEGFVNAQVHWYTIYSPRYAFTFIVNLTELVGPAIVPALPATAIVVWLALLTWSLRQFGTPAWHALVLAEVAALATLETAPDLPQSLYWQTGLLTYLLPLILATFLTGWIRRGIQSWWATGVSGLVTFVAGGLSETYLVPQNVALTLALLISLSVARHRRTHLAAALVGGVLALAVIVLSPSIGGRVGGTPADLWLAMSAAIATAAVQIVHLVRYFPLLALIALAVPALLGVPHRAACHVERRWLLLVTACVAITLPFCYFPSFYAQNGNPPARSLIVPGALLIGYLMFLGFALRPVASRWVPAPRSAVALAAVALVPLGVAVTTLPTQAQAAQYATLFDVEEQHIRAGRDAGTTDLTVPPLPLNMGEGFVGSDREDWFNQCVARYYGLRSIATPPS